MSVPGARRLSLWLCLLASIAHADLPKSASLGQLAVDVVILKSGRQIRGAIVEATDSGALTMAVSRRWIQQAAPELHEQSVDRERDLQKQALDQLEARLQTQLKAPQQAQRFVTFLKLELDRIRALRERPQTVVPQFLWVEIPVDQIGRIARTLPERQRIAQWAWSERFPDVELRDAQDLQRDLKARKIDPAATPPDLSERLAPRPQSDREWAARLALVEYALGEPLDFQGTPEVLIRADATRELSDLIPVLTQVLRSRVDSLLQDLTGELGVAPTARQGLVAASREAERIPARAFRATTVDVNLDRRAAVVETAFLIRMPKGDWETVWKYQETQDASRPRPDSEARILSDAQVRKALEAVRSLGLGAEEQVQQAVRFGAATMAAQQTADSRFFEFRDRYLKRLDGPPLTWKP